MEISLILTLVGILILLIWSAFFSGSETALTASSRPKLHALSKDGDKAAKRAEEMTEDMPKVLSTILLGNNLVNIGASAMATGLFLKLFGEAGIAIATLVMTVLVLIFSEVLPKTIASLHPETFASRISLPMLLLIKVLRPFTWLLGHTSHALMQLLRINPKNSTNFDEQDVRGAIGMALREDVLDKQEHRMLDSIFDLDDVYVSDVMVHRSQIESIDINLSPDEIFEKLKNYSHSRIPVWEENPDNIIGQVHIKDLLTSLRIAEKEGQDFNLRNIISEAYFVPEIVTIGTQLLEFKRLRRHLGLVVDEYGDILGLVTLEDILEEIVGEIEDEHDVVSHDFLRNKDGSVTISGDFAIRDANRAFDWELPEDEDAVTLSGLLVEEAQRVPNVGEEIQVGDVKFKIIARGAQVIKRLSARKVKVSH